MTSYCVASGIPDAYFMSFATFTIVVIPAGLITIGMIPSYSHLLYPL